MKKKLVESRTNNYNYSCFDEFTEDVQKEVHNAVKKVFKGAYYVDYDSFLDCLYNIATIRIYNQKEKTRTTRKISFTAHVEKFYQDIFDKIERVTLDVFILEVFGEDMTLSEIKKYINE